MPIKLTRKCYGCGESFRKENMIEIFSISGKTSQWYCVKCANEKHVRDAFSDKVCQIFGLKTPGPRIWTERKRLQNTYGYTDDIIVDCLDYIYNVKKFRKLVESLALVKPSMVDEMMTYKKHQDYNNNKIITAMDTEMKEYIVPLKKKIEKKKEQLNPDDYLFDD